MESDEEAAVARLLWELVLRILGRGSSNSNSNRNDMMKEEDKEKENAVAERAFKYALRIVGSRMAAPSVSADEAAMAESIKRQLVNQGRSSDALVFADLYRRFAALQGPGSLHNNKWSLLYLLRALSPSSSSSSSLAANLQTNDIGGVFGSTISACAAAGGLQILNPRNPSSTSSRTQSQGLGGVVDGGGAAAAGVLVLAADPENARVSALREYAEARQEECDVSEGALVRDVLYACQGVDARHVRFYQHLDAYAVCHNVKVSAPVAVMVRKLCELGWLYTKVRDYISHCIESSPSHSIGTVGQAFCAALQEELSDYYKLLALLEAQVHYPIPNMTDDGKSKSNYLSLRRLMVWLAEPTIRMRLMAVLVDDCRELRGGAMAGAIHMHAQHGDPLVRDFMGRLLCRVCSPLFEMVRSWVLEGELKDLYHEFFVVGQAVQAEALWRDGYKLHIAMLPSFIPELLAKRILRTGKSINFLRVCCNDNGWEDAAAQAASVAGASTSHGGLGYGETEALEVLVAEAAKKIDGHLIDLIYKKYMFREHCLAIKRYLLLGQGDFIQYLMDIVGSELSQPANTISSFKLAGYLESAIRASNAQYDSPEILDRLRIRMMPHNDGDRGWDVFSLEYNSRDPLNTIFTESVMTRYLKIFNFLWKLKRVEHALSATWQTMKPNCSIARMFATKDGGGKSQLVAVLRRCQTLRNEMNHFVTNLQYYIMFEVLEYSWVDFLDEMERVKDLDELIAAHESYLSSIVKKSLLEERSQHLNKILYALFDLILRFRSQAERLIESAREMQRNTYSRNKQKKNLQKLGAWVGGSRKPSQQLTAELLQTMVEEMDAIAAEYSSLLEGFIAQLPLQEHVDLKFLLFRLDFTEFYSRQQSNMTNMTQIKLGSYYRGSPLQNS